MAGLGTVPYSLLLLVLLVLPGLLGLDLYFRIARKNSTLSRTQLLVYSTGVGVVSLGVLYLLSPIYFDWLRSTTRGISNLFGYVTHQDLSQMTLAEISGLYAFHVLIAALFGSIVGKKHQTKNSDRRDPWHYAFIEIPNDGETIEVITRGGDIIRGEFNRSAWDESRRELYLEDPFKIVYGDDDKTIDEKSDLGRSTWLHEEQISQVIFTNEDPDSEQIEQVSDGEDKKDEKEALPEDVQDVLGIGGDQKKLDDLSEEQEEYSADE